ncbi:hypothetical protein ACQEVF_20840 [Nonomuraea polychroma]|uniref:hypothetical protein n=1 Tax=Nonomuraea polychroma TaxID=46176 RepID=UPI003D940480
MIPEFDTIRNTSAGWGCLSPAEARRLDELPFLPSLGLFYVKCGGTGVFDEVDGADPRWRGNIRRRHLGTENCPHRQGEWTMGAEGLTQEIPGLEPGHERRRGRLRPCTSPVGCSPGSRAWRSRG